MQAGEEFSDINLYVLPPIDGCETDKDSDNSDDEHEGNVNHLGPAMLRTFGEVQTVRRHDGSGDESSSSDESDDEPLSKKLKTDCGNHKVSKKSDTSHWVKSQPEYCIETKFEPIPPSHEAQLCQSPVDFFKLFFHDNLLESILAQTNTYMLHKKISR